MYPSEEDQQKVDTPEQYYCIAPTSVLYTKAYPAEKWAQLVSHLTKKAKVYLLGAPSDKDKCQEIIKASGTENIENLAGQLSFLESAALMRNARMNFVNDSAPLHLASAVNAPVRAIFCSTVPSLGYTPLSDDSQVIETLEKLPCRPCGITGKKNCPKKHFKCANISLEQILKTI
jgi:heptosyltransferase-2